MRFVEKFELYGRWLKRWKGLPVKDWILGAQYFREGRYHEAATRYIAGLELEPNHRARDAAKLDLAVCYSKSSRYREAEEILTELSKSSSLAAEAKRRLARLVLWRGDSVSSARLFEELGVRDADLLELLPYYLLAILETNMSEGEVSIIADRIIKLRVSDDLSLTALARYELKFGSSRRARATLSRITAKTSSPREALTAQGELHLREGNSLYARHFFRKALSISPEHPRTWSLLAESYLKSGPGYSASFALNAALNACRWSDWKSARELLVLVEAYNHNGQSEEALLITAKAKSKQADKSAPYAQDTRLSLDDVSTGTVF